MRKTTLGLLTAALLATAVGLAADQPVGSPDGPASWRPAQAALAGTGDGYLVGESCRLVGVGRRSPDARPARLSLGVLVGAGAWVNGENVIPVSDFGRYPFHGGRQAPFTLKPGWNQVLVKVEQAVRLHEVPLRRLECRWPGAVGTRLRYRPGPNQVAKP